jgi:DNA-directed RNA polymerase specialized sigma24 family protein
MDMKTSLSENEYSELYRYVLTQARKYTYDSEATYEIAHNTLLAYLSSKTPITGHKAWLSVVVKREAGKLLHERNREQEIVSKTSRQIPSPSDQQDDADAELVKLNPQKLLKVLGKEDYQIYRMLKKHDFSAARCAEKEKLKLETVKSHLRRIKRNITAAVLYEDGWRHGNKILSYQQYYNINRAISRIIESVRQHKMIELKYYSTKIDIELLEKLFADVESCYEWYVEFSEDSYKLLLVCAPLNPMPKFIEILFRFNKSNYIYILDAWENKPVLVVPGTLDKINRYKEKGKITLTGEQLVSVVTDKITKI